MVDLLKKKVSISHPQFLQFLYPHFQFITDFKQVIDYSQGVIYKGLISETILNKLECLTDGKYILLTDIGEVILYTPSDYVKILFPVIADKAEQYNNYDLEQFIPILKQYYILQKKPPLLKEDETGIFGLYKALISSKEALHKEYFSLLNTLSIKVVASSILTFLLKVKEQNFNNCSSSYKKLINTAYLKFGTRIKPAIQTYIESDQKPEIALWLLLDTLNG